MTGRCCLVYALAPGPTAREANDLLNEYVAERGRGLSVESRPPTFSLSALGFAAQTSFTLERYRSLSLDDLAAAEPVDPRFWWKRRER